MDFGAIFRLGKRKFNAKNTTGNWGNCEYCEMRKKVFSYQDNKNSPWTLCESCIDMFVEEEA